ncbi:hypothetical protein VB715_13575 [Crocosphaera sp. UHCC 0190]|uniref:hypothetical protein n=1 Tax=Crocosphaera sp. UHCC 0190 TaxID=3110246 RepID=UPI002B207934|nr:hypothetical protein [Crocosphaera sp. UHCC 0190]MEA5510798.1 hypothetical protein [Crocosphaera sp. UHCC 0190]
MKQRYLFLFPLLLFLQGSNSPPLKPFDLTQLSGDLHLTLKHGVWKLWEDKPVYQDITLDLVCDRGQCEPEVWGYAPKFNQDVDHQGKLQSNSLETPKIKTIELRRSLDAWRLKIAIQIQFHPWEPKTSEGIYNLELVPHKNQIVGSYQGTFNQRYLQGSVIGNITPLWPIPVAEHLPLSPQEHPRLIFRNHELSSLRKTSQTSIGKAILAQLKKTLEQPIYYDGYVPNGGYHATGYCFLGLLNEDKKAAEMGWKLVRKSMENPSPRLLEQSAIVAGVALAYDLCYPLWNEEKITIVTQWLAGQTTQLIKGSSPSKGWNSNAASNWNARARGAAGLAALAIMNEPSIPNHNTYPLMRMAERNLKRYFTIAIGDHGLGSEGDHYTTEPLVLTVFPFLQAYGNVMGKDLVTGSHAQWILPHYVMRMVADNKQLNVATYGRHRYYAGGSLFALGLGIIPDEFLPGIKGIFEQYLGDQGNQTFGMDSPYQAPFVLAYYNQKNQEQSQNPIALFERVFLDQQKGFYNFRNQWQDQNDFVANIYLKKQSIGGSWSFPDVGSFRILGLGEQWAIAGNSEGKWQEENVVFMPNSSPWNSSKPIFFTSNPDGSGIVSLQTNTIWRKNSKPSVGISGLRSFAVDYSGKSGVPGLFIIVDQFTGSILAEEFKEKIWVMHTKGNVKINANTFTIQGKNGSTMQGTFIAPSQVKITYQPTETGGKIMATAGNEFFIIMTVQKGKSPPLMVTGSGMTAKIKLGKQTISFDQDRIKLSTINP